jgi:hypothetical protein
MEATKCLKPSGSVSRIGDSASVQAATRVNAEQTSKRTMAGRPGDPIRGRLARLGEMSEEYARPLHRGTGGSIYTGKRTQQGKPQGMVRDDQPDAHEGQAGRTGVAERFVVPLKSSDVGGREEASVHTPAEAGGAPGVDGQDFADIEAYGVERWLAELAIALRQETYRPEPIGRVFIPKANGN